MIYHFTKEVHLQKILKDGLIWAFPEQPFVSFTRNPLWENTVFYFTGSTLEAAHLYATTKCNTRLIRISCADEVAKLRWYEMKSYCKNNGKSIWQELTNTAIRVGSNPHRDWLHSRKIIKPLQFKGIHIYNGIEWEEYEQEKICSSQQLISMKFV